MQNRRSVTVACGRPAVFDCQRTIVPVDKQELRTPYPATQEDIPRMGCTKKLAQEMGRLPGVAAHEVISVTCSLGIPKRTVTLRAKPDAERMTTVER